MAFVQIDSKIKKISLSLFEFLRIKKFLRGQLKLIYGNNLPSDDDLISSIHDILVGMGLAHISNNIDVTLFFKPTKISDDQKNWRNVEPILKKDQEVSTFPPSFRKNKKKRNKKKKNDRKFYGTSKNKKSRSGNK